MKAVFKSAKPYQQDAMNLPVANIVAPDGLCYMLGQPAPPPDGVARPEA